MLLGSLFQELCQFSCLGEAVSAMLLNPEAHRWTETL